MIHGLSRAGAERIITARRAAPFTSVEDLAARAALDQRDLKALAAAGALASLTTHRRAAYWEVAGIEDKPPLFHHVSSNEEKTEFPAPSEAENLVADYASLGLTLGRHPLALLRDTFIKRRMLTAEQIRQLPDGKLVRAVGLVTGRQRPDTASGVIFVTLEDETGYVNVVVWSRLAEKQRRELLQSSLLGVYGRLERQGEVAHLVAGRLVDYSELLGQLEARSRDFH